jgi:hypothetical protein
MKGHIQQRGKNSWRLKFDAGLPNEGVHKTNQAVGAAIEGAAEQKVH